MTEVAPWSKGAYPTDCQHCAAVFWTDGTTTTCPHCRKSTRVTGADNLPWTWYVTLIAAVRRSTMARVHEKLKELEP